MNLFRGMGGGQSLFANELALDYNFIPKLIPFREMQQKQVAGCIKPLFDKRNGKNIVILGPPGVGKTVACRHIMNELEEETDEIIPIYINCWQKNTSYKVVVELCNFLDYKFTQNKKTEELFEIVKNILNKKSAVFVFDEIDKAEDYDFIYTLLEDIYRKTIVLITNYKTWIVSLDDRIKSRLIPEMLEFRPYSQTEIKGILKERISYAFAQNTVDENAVDFIAKKTIEAGEGDIRIGLYLLKEAGDIADMKNSSKLALEHAEDAAKKLSDFSVKKTDDLDDDCKKIMSVIKIKNGGKIGDLFRSYQEEGGKIAYKSFQRKVAKLEENKFINTEKIMGGSEGTTTMIKLVYDKKLT